MSSSPARHLLRTAARPKLHGAVPVTKQTFGPVQLRVCATPLPVPAAPLASGQAGGAAHRRRWPQVARLLRAARRAEPGGGNTGHSLCQARALRPTAPRALTPLLLRLADSSKAISGKTLMSTESSASSCGARVQGSRQAHWQHAAVGGVARCGHRVLPGARDGAAQHVCHVLHDCSNHGGPARVCCGALLACLLAPHLGSGSPYSDACCQGWKSRTCMYAWSNVVSMRTSSPSSEPVEA
jgi:hypothetical protein